MKSQIERAIERVNDGSIETKTLVQFFEKHTELKVNWQDKNKLRLWETIKTIFNDSLMKDDPLSFVHQPDAYKNILNSGLNTAFLIKNTILNLNKNTDIIILPPFQESNYIYFIPCSYLAFVWINNFSCGYTPARWCLGQVDTKLSPIPFYYARFHILSEFYIVGIHKQQYKNLDKNKGKLLFEFTSAGGVKQQNDDYVFDYEDFSGLPIQVYTADNFFIQFSDKSSKVPSELSKCVFTCFKHKDDIPLYHFFGWSDQTFKKFTSFAEKSATYRPIKE